MERTATPDGRTLTWWQLALVVIVYLAIIQVGGRVIGAGVDSDNAYETATGLVESALIPIAISCVFAIAVASWLGWWPEIVREPRRTQRWVAAIPIVLLVAALVGASWGNLADQKADLVLALVALVCLVGFTEELMFRGIGVVTMRRHGLTEARVALWSSLLFGAVHLSNALGSGATAIGQAIAVSLTGCFLYLTRRWAGAIWLAMPVHASQDFALLSGQIGVDPEQSPLGVVVILAMLGLAVLVWHRRHRISSEPASTRPGAASS